MGERKLHNFQILANGCSTVVEHMPHHLKVKVLSPRPVSGTGSEKMANNLQILVSGCSTVVEHMPHHLKVKGLSSTTSGANGNAKMAGRGGMQICTFCI